jgi:hypothetical protein
MIRAQLLLTVYRVGKALSQAEIERRRRLESKFREIARNFNDDMFTDAEERPIKEGSTITLKGPIQYNMADDNVVVFLMQMSDMKTCYLFRVDGWIFIPVTKA